VKLNAHCACCLLYLLIFKKIYSVVSSIPFDPTISCEIKIVIIALPDSRHRLISFKITDFGHFFFFHSGCWLLLEKFSLLIF